MDPTQILVGLLTIAASAGSLWAIVRNQGKRADEERAEMRAAIGELTKKVDQLVILSPTVDELRGTLDDIAEKVDKLVILPPTVENHEIEIRALRERVHVNANTMTTLLAKQAEIATAVAGIATSLTKRRR